MTVTVFVADDEPPARRRLASLVAEVPWARQVGEAGDGATAVTEIQRLRPNVVFLDIRMPELSGLAVVESLRAIDEIPAIVFTSAFDEYAVTAFELEAVDYLLKPFGQSRFQTAIERARMSVEHREGGATLDRAHTVLSQSAAPAVLERILVREGRAVVPLAPAEITRIEAQDDYAMVFARGRGYLLGVRLRDLETRLPRPPFLRVHRSHIVNLDAVERMEPQDDGRFAIHMKDGTCIQASRARSQEIRRESR
ncbi:LytTR family DNA-binding domain-containing protein [Nitratireductor sp. ZSWI3]|uniref:LytR/AlgR family response regulator transcription factor n=1 Tax=Nitratireductor sp. ZSWI3 TaxID=2966359 RepID=UPI00214FF4AE|nr:LytTR family DNA-binding domain-containing protein [Nitratireductor sp. ZSWI3]MCR4265902.1 LytTR family DNA-binding domain-containing protein [Nitratireductor sp. ZSWI3]